MIINWTSLIGGLALGLVPARMLLNCECRYLTFDDLWVRVIRPMERIQRRRRWWKLPLLWIDPFRGYFVAGFLFDSFLPDMDSSNAERIAVTGFVGVLLLIVIWLQSLGRPGVRETVSPAGFLAGIVISVLPLEVSLPVLVLGFSAALAAKNYTVGYLTAMAATMGFGVIFMGKSPKLGLLALIVFFPVIVNWLRRSQLVTPVRC